MINWSNISNRSILGKSLRFPLKLIPKTLVVPIMSGPMKGMKWQIKASDHGCWLGTYELAKQLALIKWLQPGMTVYDIGANAGIYTLFFARAVGSQGHVIAFEPFAKNVMNLLNHIRLNDLENVRLVQAALAKQNGLASFRIGEFHTTGALSSASTQLQIPTFSIDELISKFHYPAPDLIKMDVEGGESEVLSGASDLLSRHTSVWFVALHGKEQHKLCHDILEGHQYQSFNLDGTPINGRLENMAQDEIYAVPAAWTRSSGNQPIKS